MDAAWTMASCSVSEGMVSRVFRKALDVSCTTLPAHSGRADNFFSRGSRDRRGHVIRVEIASAGRC